MPTTDPFAPPVAGDISPFVSSLNTIGSALEVLRNLPSPRGQLQPAGDEIDHKNPVPHSSVLVRNDTGSSLDALSVLKLGASLQNIETQAHDIFRMPAFAGTTPAAASDCFAVMLESVGVGQIAVGAIRGVAVCYVYVTSTAHKWAAPKASVNSYLLSGESGPARILTALTTTGRQLCAVLIDDRGDRLVKLDALEDPVNSEPASDIRQYSADAPDTSTPVVRQLVADNIDGAGTNGITQAVLPNGTGSTTGATTTTTPTQQLTTYVLDGATGYGGAVKASSVLNVMVGGNSALSQGLFVAPTISGGNVTQVVQNYVIWDGSSAIAKALTLTAAGGAIAVAVPAGMNWTFGGTVTFAGTVLLTDHDYGHITVSAGGTVWTIDDGVVTLPKLADLAGWTVIGKSGTVTGPPGSITATAAGQVLRVDPTGVALGFGAVDLTSANAVTGTLPAANLPIGTSVQAFDATLSALAAANWAANALPIGSGADTLSQVSFAANTFPARASSGNLVAKTITDASLTALATGLGTLATQSGTFSGTSSGTNTGDQTITLTGDVTGSGTGSFAATIANDAVTYAKLQNASATQRILARHTAGAGDFEEVTLANVLSWFGNAVGNLVHYSSGGGWSALALGTADYVLTANASTGATWTAPVTSSNGETVGSFTITAANNTYEASGLSVSLPSAGTYHISGTIRGQLNLATGSNGEITVKLRNTTDSADITNSETLIVYAPAAGTLAEASGSLAKTVTVTGAKTIEIYVKRTGGGTWTTSSLTSDTNGRTRFEYVKLNT